MGYLLIVAGAWIINLCIGGVSEGDMGQYVYETRERNRDINDTLRGDRRGPIHLERNAKTSDPLFQMPTHKPSMFKKGVR